MTSDDLFPTRLRTSDELLPRIDPVVHNRNQERWNGPLDEVYLSRFERDGFLWLEGFFARERLEPFFDELRDLARDATLMASDQVIKDPASGSLCSVFGMDQLSPRFERLTRDPRLLGMARQLLGGDVYIHQARIDDQPALAGRRTDWHSDFETWHAEDGMPHMRALTASILLTETNEFNGPLMLIPGSHQHFVPCTVETAPDTRRRPPARQPFGTPSPHALERLVAIGGLQAPKGPIGSLLLLDCNTLHASNNNLSPWRHASLSFVYNSIDNLLLDPYCGRSPRPEFLARRHGVAPLHDHDDVAPWSVRRYSADR